LGFYTFSIVAFFGAFVKNVGACLRLSPTREIAGDCAILCFVKNVGDGPQSSAIQALV